MTNKVESSTEHRIRSGGGRKLSLHTSVVAHRTRHSKSRGPGGEEGRDEVQGVLGSFSLNVVRVAPSTRVSIMIVPPACSGWHGRHALPVKISGSAAAMAFRRSRMERLPSLSHRPRRRTFPLGKWTSYAPIDGGGGGGS